MTDRLPHPRPARAQNLRDLLHALTPADDLEARWRDDVLALLDGAAGDPFSRDHFVPGHVTASAFVLSPSGGELLLIEHSKLHRWLQPGGHVDPGDESVFAAAQREVAEEVGLPNLPPATGHGSGLFDVDVHVIPARKGDPEHRHFDVRFLLQSPTMEVIAGSDAKAARWVPLGEVNAEASDESVMRAVRKLLRA